MRHALLAVLGLATLPLLAGTPLLEGVVFNDLNGDGIRQDGEPPVVGAEVSNGERVVVTGADGRYALPAGPEPIFVVAPHGWAVPVDPDHKPLFWHPDGGDFALHPSAEPEAFKVLVLTDTQPATDAELSFLQRSVIAQWAGRSGCDFGVTLGDLSYDRPDFFPRLSKLFGSVGIPWHTIPGNHDVGLLAGSEAGALRAYVATFGPSTYAFRRGHALFLALDDVRPRGGPRFTGSLLASQLAFIQAILERTDPSDLVVVMAHIPFFPDPPGAHSFDWGVRAKLFALLKGHDHALILSSHTHVQRHVFHGADEGWQGAEPLHEYNVAAACGGFWGGPLGANGLPPSTMWDGTPPGSAVVLIQGNAFTLDYFPSELPHSEQLSVWAPPVIAPRVGYVAGYANVFNGYPEGWTVESRVDERGWTAMQPTLGWDPAYARAWLDQDRGPKPAPRTRLPDPVICNHLWRTYLPADLSVGRHALEVKATDPMGHAYTQACSFEVARP